MDETSSRITGLGSCPKRVIALENDISSSTTVGW